MPTRTKGNAPVRKVTAAGIAGAVGLIIVFCLNTYVLPPDKLLTAEIAAAISTVLAFLAGYIIPPGKNESNVTTDG